MRFDYIMTVKTPEMFNELCEYLYSQKHRFKGNLQVNSLITFKSKCTINEGNYAGYEFKEGDRCIGIRVLNWSINEPFIFDEAEKFLSIVDIIPLNDLLHSDIDKPQENNYFKFFTENANFEATDFSKYVFKVSKKKIIKRYVYSVLFCVSLFTFTMMLTNLLEDSLAIIYREVLIYAIIFWCLMAFGITRNNSTLSDTCSIILKFGFGMCLAMITFIGSLKNKAIDVGYERLYIALLSLLLDVSWQFFKVIQKRWKKAYRYNMVVFSILFFILNLSAILLIREYVFF